MELPTADAGDSERRMGGAEDRRLLQRRDPDETVEDQFPSAEGLNQSADPIQAGDGRPTDRENAYHPAGHQVFSQAAEGCSPAEGSDSLSVVLLKKRLRENLHRLKIAPVHMAAQLLVPQWRLQDYAFAPADECRAFLEEKMADEARMLASSETVAAPPARQRAPTGDVATVDFLMDSSDEDEAPISQSGGSEPDVLR